MKIYEYRYQNINSTKMPLPMTMGNLKSMKNRSMTLNRLSDFEKSGYCIYFYYILGHRDFKTIIKHKSYLPASWVRIPKGAMTIKGNIK